MFFCEDIERCGVSTCLRSARRVREDRERLWGHNRAVVVYVSVKTETGVGSQ